MSTANCGGDVCNRVVKLPWVCMCVCVLYCVTCPTYVCVYMLQSDTWYGAFLHVGVVEYKCIMRCCGAAVRKCFRRRGEWLYHVCGAVSQYMGAFRMFGWSDVMDACVQGCVSWVLKSVPCEVMVTGAVAMAAAFQCKPQQLVSAA